MENQYLNLPLQANGGELRRSSRSEAARQLLQAMAITPVGRWSGGDRFGINDLLLDCSRVQQAGSRQMREVTTVAEAVLADFGFSGCRLAPERAAVSRYSSLEFDFVLTWPSGDAEPVTIKLFY